MLRTVLYVLAAAALVLSAQPRGGNGKGKGKGQAKSKGEMLAAAKSIPGTVIELFTSEGCSSCPPADALLAALDTGANNIVLGEHVDYWDADGWKDRFSSPLFSARQQDYGTALHLANVFTPQVVVNGRASGTASDTNELSRALREGSIWQPAEVELRISDAKTLSLKVRKLPPDSNKADVLMLITESRIETEVSSGENQGRKLRHAPVVHSITKLTELDPDTPGEYGAEARLSVRPEWNRENLRVVILVQDQKNLHILGSAQLKLAKETLTAR